MFIIKVSDNTSGCAHTYCINILHIDIYGYIHAYVGY